MLDNFLCFYDDDDDDDYYDNRDYYYHDYYYYCYYHFHYHYCHQFIIITLYIIVSACSCYVPQHTVLLQIRIAHSDASDRHSV